MPLLIDIIRNVEAVIGTIVIAWTTITMIAAMIRYRGSAERASQRYIR